MQRLEVSGAVRHIYASLGFEGLTWVWLDTRGSVNLDGKTITTIFSQSQTEI